MKVDSENCIAEIFQCRRVVDIIFIKINTSVIIHSLVSGSSGLALFQNCNNVKEYEVYTTRVV